MTTLHVYVPVKSDIPSICTRMPYNSVLPSKLLPLVPLSSQNKYVLLHQAVPVAELTLTEPLHLLVTTKAAPAPQQPPTELGTGVPELFQDPSLQHFITRSYQRFLSQTLPC